MTERRTRMSWHASKLSHDYGYGFAVSTSRHTCLPHQVACVQFMLSEICLSFFCLPILLVTLVLLSCVRSELATAVREVGRRLAEANPQVAPRIGVTERAWQSDLGEIERLCGCVNINL